jgi:DNA-binding MarR family transcriptional regulator
LVIANFGQRVGRRSLAAGARLEMLSWLDQNVLNQWGMAGPSGQQELAADTLIRTWTKAMHFRRLAEAELRAHNISFALWWVLYTTDQLIRELDDDHAISQQAVSWRTGLDKSTVSYLMGVLADRALVDRGPDAFDRSYRIILTQEGRQLLAQSWSAIERAVHRAFAEPSARAVPARRIKRAERAR